MDTSDRSDDLDVAVGWLLATVFSLSLWSLVLTLWFLLRSPAG